MPNFHPTTLKERNSYYLKEFDINKVKSWFKRNNLAFPQICAVDMGSETGIIKDKKKKDKMINIRARHLPEKLLYYLPEDVYYDRNYYRDPEIVLQKLNFREQWKSNNLLGQELAFDIDPENIKCSCNKKTDFLHSHLCEECMKKTVGQAINLAEFLKQNYSKLGFVYSGRGMHVHVFDKDAFTLTIKQRQKLSMQAKKYSIDPWVSRGYIRLMRLPYSLNSLVSRIVLPITKKEIETFNPWTSSKTKPKFVHKIHSSISSSSSDSCFLL